MPHVATADTDTSAHDVAIAMGVGNILLVVVPSPTLPRALLPCTFQHRANVQSAAKVAQQEISGEARAITCPAIKTTIAVDGASCGPASSNLAPVRIRADFRRGRPCDQGPVAQLAIGVVALHVQNAIPGFAVASPCPPSPGNEMKLTQQYKLPSERMPHA